MLFFLPGYLFLSNNYFMLTYSLRFKLGVSSSKKLFLIAPLLSYFIIPNDRINSVINGIMQIISTASKNTRRNVCVAQ